MNKAIIILGMHRSGTSMLMRTLNNLGVYIGREEDLLAINEDNPEGFWEHSGIVEIHENILTELNHRWDSLAPLPIDWLDNSKVQKYKLELINLVKREFGSMSVWGFKDPRTCILLPLWKEIFENLGIEASYIITLRNPLDVAESLYKRNGINLKSGITLWYYHMINVTENLKGCNKLVLYYDSIVEETLESAEKIATFTGFELNNEIEIKIRESIKTELRHSKSSVAELSLLSEEKIAYLYTNFVEVLESQRSEMHNIESYNFYYKLFQIEELNNQDQLNKQEIEELFNRIQQNKHSMEELLELNQENSQLVQDLLKQDQLNKQTIAELSNKDQSNKQLIDDLIKENLENRQLIQDLNKSLTEASQSMDQAMVQSIALAHTKLFKCVHFIYRLKHQLFKGNFKTQRNFFDWIYRKLIRREPNHDHRYNPIFQIINILEKKKKTEPDFLIIGAQKAGTTSLYHYLVQHPLIDSAVTKEVHFFDVNYDKGVQWYRDQFPSFQTKSDHLTGEATPYYIFHPNVPKRIYEMMPRTKIIILLRNPIDRAYSHYHHAVRNLGEVVGFEEAIHMEEERLAGEFERFQSNSNYNSEIFQHYSYLKRGIYVDQLKLWFDLFPKHQILILNYESFFGDLPKSMKAITDFLGVPEFEFQYESLNKGEYEPMNPKTREHLRKYFYPHNQKLFRLLGQRYDWD
ncbi:sulfotransferase domain-containing protein [Paenibacillus whitsoniae]|uniref:Sulfotransferase domain-containing protein n=1 Tax=Paenibacillus whitsoniae TaxID=2496558 RepID=A0A430JAS0_9BACL|nr:sulfotransferase domain-containing protein [Paenibacillus whitsoniae]RTE08149.1 hypothetical protein EJQ19_18850 [Paenibacillus whitsoniae]